MSAVRLSVRLVPLVLTFTAAQVIAQTYPARPIRIVTAEVGGANDIPAREIAHKLAAPLGQPVIVENRSGVISIETAAKAVPDGYTVLFIGSAMWLAPLLRDKVSYDPVKDFSPVTLAVSSPNILVVHPSVPVNSVKDLIALAKAKPGALNYASGSAGTITHLAAELFKAMAGVNIVRIPYKGGGPAIIGLIGGQVQLMFASAGSVTTAIKSGKVKGIAVTTAKPSVLAPGLPTIAASGLPGYEAATPYGMLAPAKTPPAVIQRLNREVVRVLNDQELKERLLNGGAETVGNTPEQFAATIRSEMKMWGKVIKDGGIRDE
jgi:tripartite-type tricarboxylate transporter receptor subunit TctC